MRLMGGWPSRSALLPRWGGIGGALCMTAAALSIASPALAQQRPAHLLRVCADPLDLPFSTDKQEGFENKIAAIIAKDLGDSLTFTWWPTRRGFVRNTLGMRRCDLMMAAPKGYDLVIETNPYYRSTYYIVTRSDRNIKLTSLDDSLLKTLRVGVNQLGDNYENTPPAEALGKRGIVKNVTGFSTFYDEEGHVRPSDIIDAVTKGTIDVALAWGPIAGYYAKHSSVPLNLVPLPDTDRVTGFPFAYDIGMGVRRGDNSFRDLLNQVLQRRKADIDSVLRDYGVPTLPLAPATASSSPK